MDKNTEVLRISKIKDKQIQMEEMWRLLDKGVINTDEYKALQYRLT